MRYINTLCEGETIRNVYLCKGKRSAETRNGKPYDNLILQDKTGRKLDFIAQEMNREANTILSKSNDLSISDTGINLKTDIEKVREQIQNIE